MVRVASIHYRGKKPLKPLCCSVDGSLGFPRHPRRRHRHHGYLAATFKVGRLSSFALRLMLRAPAEKPLGWSSLMMSVRWYDTGVHLKRMFFFSDLPRMINQFLDTGPFRPCLVGLSGAGNAAPAQELVISFENMDSLPVNQDVSQYPQLNVMVSPHITVYLFWGLLRVQFMKMFVLSYSQAMW